MTVKINADTSDGLKFVSDTSGTVDIQSNGTTKFTVGSTIDCQGNELILDSDSDTSIHASTDDQIDLKCGGTDRFSINGSGHCTYTFDASTGSGIIINDTNSSSSSLNIQFFKRNSSEVGKIVTTNSSTSYSTSSDYRLKENVTYTFDATTRLKQLKPARFNFKVDADKTVDGFIAHEVSSIVPEAISGEKDGEEMQSIDQSKLVPLLVKTIQELEARITALES
tara:strand:+ start:177 stop:848 length:672 start_codon:yes stop_codon:yes gene_type:complete